MEPKGSLPHSLLTATCPYPAPDRSNPCTHIPLPERFIIILSPIYVWVFQIVSFVVVSQPKPCIHLSSSPYALHAPPISFFLNWSHKILYSLIKWNVLVIQLYFILGLILLSWRIWWAPNNAIKWQMGFNWAFKGLIDVQQVNYMFRLHWVIISFNKLHSEYFCVVCS
jgi:hypothetical protein